MQVPPNFHNRLITQIIKNMNQLKAISAVLICALFIPACTTKISKDEFKHPPIQYWPRPLWFWNNTTVDEQGITEQIQALHDLCGYGGFGVVPFGKNFSPEYLSEDYLKLYGIMLKKAKELDMTISLYDEFGFPSGSVGAFAEGDGKPRFQLKYPDQTIKRLDKAEDEITGPFLYATKIPEGKIMGAVAMETNTRERIDITGKVSGGMLKWDVPAGKWKIMIFTCVLDGHPVVDYLNPDACIKFTHMVHDVYFDRFREYFGTTVGGTFFDEPSMFNAQFRTWTDMFNEKFEKKHGFSPVILYPALWYDIGPETQSARNYLFGFRAELYATGFVKVVSDWSVAHGITATGHNAPEEALIPVNASGDLMKSAKYLEMPGIDKIGGHRYAERFYKLISSAAYNWDKRLVMSETYGAMPNYDDPANLKWNDFYAIAMDQYTKGINMLIPHAVWYDNTKVTYRPELSYRNPLYADSLKFFTQFLARLNLMLQREGRHVADIGILYPISSLQGQHFFDDRKGPSNIDGPPDPSNEFYKEQVAEIDYVDVANRLTNVAGKDFTFIHPEVLDEKCSIVDRKLHLENITNTEDFSILIIPSCKTISVSNLQKITDFYNAGGILIFTTRLPYKSCEIGQDQQILQLIKSVFPAADTVENVWYSNANGGKAIFIPSPDGDILRKACEGSGCSFDVDYPENENIQYIHKVNKDQELYYFANLGASPVSMQITLRGELSLESCDPRSGEIGPLKSEVLPVDKSPVPRTSVHLDLKPFQSVFWVGNRMEGK